MEDKLKNFVSYYAIAGMIPSLFIMFIILNLNDGVSDNWVWTLLVIQISFLVLQGGCFHLSKKWGLK